MGYIGNAPYNGVITGDSIQDGTVDTADITNDAVTTVKIADGAVTAGKLAAGAIPDPTTLEDSSGNTVVDASSGYVGIGTSSPSEPLDVMAISANSRVMIGDSGISNIPVIKARNSSDSGYRILGYDAYRHQFFTENSEAMRIDSSGNVGIGTSSPSSDNGTTVFAHIGSSSKAAAGLVLEDDENKWEIISNGNLSIADGNTERMRIDSAGRVTMPYQPSFHVGKNNSPTVSAGNYFIFNYIRHNTGSHYNNATGRFTAPIDGVYHFSWSNITHDNSIQNEWYFHLNGSRYVDTRDDTQNNRHQTLAASVTTYLSAGDWVALYVDSGVMYANGENWSHFSGHLVG
jgi:hypothetical protein